MKFIKSNPKSQLSPAIQNPTNTNATQCIKFMTLQYFLERSLEVSHLSVLSAALLYAQDF